MLDRLDLGVSHVECSFASPSLMKCAVASKRQRDNMGGSDVTAWVATWAA
jgi:hypothetical protein